jgi:hypothetical protein
MNKKTYTGIKKNRYIHYIDIENICGTADLTADMVARARIEYLERVVPGKDDQYFVTASHHNMQAVCFGWPNARHGFRSGKDGGDILLAQDIVYGHPETLFRGVYVASGDHGLSPFVGHLLELDLPVIVVSGKRQMSYMMSHTGAPVLYLESDFSLAA